MMAGVPRPHALRSPDDVIPKLGVRPGTVALRVGDVAAYDLVLEHAAGHLDRVPLRIPLRVRAARYGLVLAFVLAPVDLDLLARDLTRVMRPEGRVWIVVWKKTRSPHGAPTWDAIQEAVLPTGWVDNKVLSLGDELYGTQYVLRKDRMRRPPRA